MESTSIKSPRQQLEIFRSLISGKRLDRTSPTFAATLDWLRVYPGDMDPQTIVEFRGMVCGCWGITNEELDAALAMGAAEISIPASTRQYRYSKAELEKAKEEEREFDKLVPEKGFFREFIEYTKESEGPIVYHFFTAVIGLAATINRRIGFPFGPVGSIYPPLGVILLGPSGIKKTSSSDIMVSMLTELGVVPIYSEKVTPEALVETMSKGRAVGLIYAPEMSVFLGKSSYMEGIVPLLTRLMDSPDRWVSETIGGGKRELTEVALSCLMCSTSDWFVSNTPADMFGGGFIARNLLVHQTISPRIIPIPQARSDGLRRKCLNELTDIHVMMGNMHFSPVAEKTYKEFYFANKMEKPEHEMMESYHQRKGSHSIRLAMLIHLSVHKDFEICENCYLRALSILSWTERYLPSLMKSMFRSEGGMETEVVLRSVRAHSGPIPHSTLVRKMQYKMNAEQLKKILRTLIESGDIKEHHDKFSHTYQVNGETNE